MSLTSELLRKQNVTAPSFQLYNSRTAATGTDGTISILANSSTLDEVTMGFITVDTEVTTSLGTGSLALGVNIAGTLTEFLTLNDSNDGEVSILKNLEINDNSINNVSSIQISDSVSAVHGLLQGLTGTGVRLTLTSGEALQILDNITNIFSLNTASGLVLGTGLDLTIGTGGNILHFPYTLMVQTCLQILAVV